MHSRQSMYNIADLMGRFHNLVFELTFSPDSLKFEMSYITRVLPPGYIFGAISCSPLLAYLTDLIQY